MHAIERQLHLNRIEDWADNNGFKFSQSKKKFVKALNLLRVVSNNDWGGDRTVLLRLYRALVRSKLDYGCFIYGEACKSYISLLDPIQNQGLRLSLGAFRTSPAQSLCVEANELPLHLRREKFALQFVTKIAANPNNAVYDTIFAWTFLLENQESFQLLVFVLRSHCKNWILILTSSQSLNFLKLLHGHIQLLWSTSLFRMPRKIKRILRST